MSVFTRPKILRFVSYYPDNTIKLLFCEKFAVLIIFTDSKILPKII